MYKVKLTIATDVRSRVRSYCRQSVGPQRTFGGEGGGRWGSQGAPGTGDPHPHRLRAPRWCLVRERWGVRRLAVSAGQDMHSSTEKVVY